MILKSGRETRLDRRRRDFLQRALALGWLSGAGWNAAALAQTLGKRPTRLPEGKSIFDLQGEVLVNGRPATMETILKPTDVVKTGAGARLIGVLGQDALLLRQNTEVRFNNSAAAGAKSFFRLVTGAMLAVFGPRRERFEIQTPVATIGIRGTGVYTESDPEKSYICTCYGLTQLSAIADPKATEQIKATHHDAARYVLAKPDQGRIIVPAPFINHDDLELMTLEALVGREVPFGIPDSQYERPRREY